MLADNLEIPRMVTVDLPRPQHELRLLDHDEPQPVLGDQHPFALVVAAALLTAVPSPRRYAGPLDPASPMVK